MSVHASSPPPSVLTFGYADATAGGGVQADVLTIASMGCHPLSVVCAIAVRDTRGLEEMLPVDPDAVVAQARAVLEDIPVHAFRVGMVGSVENLAAIAEILADYPDIPLVIEPGLSYLDGLDGQGEDFADALVELLMPLASVVVIGPHDLARLSATIDDHEGDEQDEQDETAEGIDFSDGMDEAQSDEEGHYGVAEIGVASALEPGSQGNIRGVERLIGLGAGYVLLTGAGEPGPNVVNFLYGPSGRIRADAWERLGGQFLGARATLASATAAALAHGMEVAEACQEAQEFVWQALSSGYRLGMGLAVPDRLFWAREEASDED